MAKWQRRARETVRQIQSSVLANLRNNRLWQRILKNTTCTTIVVIIGIIPAVTRVLGRATFVGAMVSVFAHPGQRFGQMAENLLLVLFGVLIGMGWASIGLYLSSLAAPTNLDAAYAIRAVFFAVALAFHGVVRSIAPRLFLFVLFLILVALTTLTSTATNITHSGVTRFLYPVFVACGVVVLANVSIFSEFSSDFLGSSTISTLSETVACLEDAGSWFLLDSRKAVGSSDGTSTPTEYRRKLAVLTDKKSRLRDRLARSKAAQAECNFELVFAVLSPRSLKPISTVSMTRLVQDTIALINVCESKFALTGDDDPIPSTQVPSAVDETEESCSSTDSGGASSSEEEGEGEEDQQEDTRAPRKTKHQRNIELVKPIREIEFGDAEFLENLLDQVRPSVKILEVHIHDAVQVLTSVLSYCYDVAKLPSGASTPAGIALEEIDVRIDIFSEAISTFDAGSAEALEKAAVAAYGDDSRVGYRSLFCLLLAALSILYGIFASNARVLTDERALQIDLMPRMETHLVSSLLINMRQGARQLMDMLRYSRALVQRRQERAERRTFHVPRISWKKWLRTGGEQDGRVLPEGARREARSGHGMREDEKSSGDDTSDEIKPLTRHRDVETGEAGDERTHPSQSPAGKVPYSPKEPQKPATNDLLWLRGLAADFFEFFRQSDDLAYAFKLCVAGFLVTWPGFVPSWNPWYASIRGTWASLQLVIVFEVSVGTSFQGFFVRAAGVIVGCTVGFLAYEIGQGNRIVAVIVLVLGIMPSSYVQLGTPYVKAGVISITSMVVVCLATIVQFPEDESWRIYYTRLACFTVGGVVALLVELVLFPVRARDRLVESLASSIKQLANMEASIAVGVDQPSKLDKKALELSKSFKQSKERAEQALGAAKTFLPFTLTEPRLKGSFKGQALVYGEMIYVLFQIIDRMDNILRIRNAFGSQVLEDLNAQILPYRRNVAAAITLTLFAVHEALTTRLPLPQFLPSCRAAQLRFISRVREVLLSQQGPDSDGESAADAYSVRHRGSVALEGHVLKTLARQSFLAWNAGSAGMIEMTEYLEELVDLTKLLVGVSAFRSGLLERPNFREYAEKAKGREIASVRATETEQVMKRTMSASGGGFWRGREFSLNRAESGDSGLRRRRTAGLRTGDGADDVEGEGDAGTDELPMSLQRVRTKRITQERERGRRPRRGSGDAKGKGVLRSTKTWQP